MSEPEEKKPVGEEGGDEGGDDVEAEAQVDFKPLIEVRTPPRACRPEHARSPRPFRKSAELPPNLAACGSGATQERRARLSMPCVPPERTRRGSWGARDEQLVLLHPVDELSGVAEGSSRARAAAFSP